MTAASAPRHPHRRLVFAACMLATFTAAIEATIVATSMPSIVAEVGGFKLYAWVFSIYVLTQVVSAPIYGRLSDTWGRKPVLISGLVLFLAGSLASGFATSMPMLIACRFFQGFGAGATQPVSMTLVGDLYALEERASIQGYISSVWGLSAVVGPIGGGLIVATLGWSWIFWLSIPFGLAALVLVAIYHHENLPHARPRIDLPGAALIFTALSCLIVALTMGGDLGYAITGGLIVAAFVVFRVLLWHARRAAHPIIDLALWAKPFIARGNLASLVAGVVMIGPISFLPAYVQGVLERSVMVGGFVIAGMPVAWMTGSIISSRIYARTGARKLSRIAGVSMLIGTLVIALGVPHSPYLGTLGMAFVGLAMGYLTTAYLFGIQASLAWSERGSATASMMLMRMLGNAIGAALFGGILNHSLQNFLDANPDTLDGRSVPMESVRNLLAGHGVIDQSAAVLATLRGGLDHSLQLVFWAVAAAGLVGLFTAWRVPEVAPAKPAAG
jgi:MFS family permease